MDPHDLSRFYHDWNEALSFLLFSYYVDDIQFGLEDWVQAIMNSHLREGPEIKSNHVGGDFLLF